MFYRHPDRLIVFSALFFGLVPHGHWSLKAASAKSQRRDEAGLMWLLQNIYSISPLEKRFSISMGLFCNYGI